MAVVAWKNVSILRGLSICCVVAAHSSNVAYGPLAKHLGVWNPGQFSLAFFTMLCIKSLAAVGLPTFVFASGFMFYRMYKGWSSVRSTCLNILKKYLLWAVPLFGLISIARGTFDWQEILISLITGGPMIAYWFFILLLGLFFLAPTWIFLLKKYPHITFLLVFLLEVLILVKSYYYRELAIPFLIKRLIILPLQFSPPFVIGLYFSMNVRKIIDAMNGKRLFSFVLIIISAYWCIAESLYWGSIVNWQSSKMSMCFIVERVSTMAFFLSVIAFLMTLDSRKTWWRAWFSQIGMSTLGIFLMMDIFIKFSVALIWHLPNGLNSLLPLTINSPVPDPIWIYQYPTIIFLFYFFSGLWGPLWSMKLMRSLLGPKANNLF